jgi:hypothetical protein
LISGSIVSCLKELESLKSTVSAAKSPFYGCDEHPTKDIEYYCSLDQVLMCAGCAIKHSDHRSLVVPYPWTTFKKDAQVFIGNTENVQNECVQLRTQLKLYLAGKPEPGATIVATLIRNLRLAAANGHIDIDFVVFPDPSSTGIVGSTTNLSSTEIQSLTRIVGAGKRLQSCHKSSLRGGSIVKDFYEAYKNRDGTDTLSLITVGDKKVGFYFGGAWNTKQPGNWIPSSSSDYAFMIEPKVKLMAAHSDCGRWVESDYSGLIVGSDEFIISPCGSCDTTNMGAIFGQ